VRRLRLCFLDQWAGAREDASAYAARAAARDLRPLVADPRDPELLRKARLDCDWYAANARCLAAVRVPGAEMLPAWVVGLKTVLDAAAAPREPGEERWLVTMAQQPQRFGPLAGRVFELLARAGVRHLYYAFDEASRAMPCFAAVAPWLDVLIHDEDPLDPAAAARLRPACVRRHRSWVANFAPGEAGFDPAAEERIVFVGSQLGLTPHRRRQIEHLAARFGDRFTAICDHGLPVEARTGLSRFRAGFCPEGRMFATPAMAASHTDRPFWFGCLGLVPVSEDSAAGGRLENLHRAGLIERYPRGDLAALVAACERALAAPVGRRRRIHGHYNAHETIGAVVAEALAAAGG
jgi:hypothetical protein